MSPKSSPAHKTQLRHPWTTAIGALLMLAVANLWFYRQTLTNTFFGNDLYLVYGSMDLPSYLAAFGLDFQRAMRDAFRIYYYRPLFADIIRGLIGVFGLNFPLWHAVMLAVHIINSMLVFILFRRYFSRRWLALGGAVFWSIGFYKADAVMWLACAHVYVSFICLMMLVLSPRLNGFTGIAARAGMLGIAVLIHETAWPFAGVLVLEAWLARRERIYRVAGLGFAIVALAIPFALLYRHIASTSLFPKSEFSIISSVQNYLPLLTALFVPFHLMQNKLNQWTALHGYPRIEWIHVLIPFWIAVGGLLWRVSRALPKLPKKLSQDRIMWWGILWTMVLLVPGAQYEPWLHGRHAYMISVGLILALGRAAEHWMDLSPQKKPSTLLISLASILIATQLIFSIRVLSHMNRGYREVPAMVADLKSREKPPLPGETWVVEDFPFYEQEIMSFLRYDYGKSPAVMVFPGKAVKLPEGRLRRLRYDGESVKLVKAGK